MNRDYAKEKIKTEKYLKQISGGEYPDYEFMFGKLKGHTLSDAAEYDKDYLFWIMQSDFPEGVKEIIQNVMDDWTAYLMGVKK